MHIPTEGYLDNQNWWHDPSNPRAFTYCDLDEFYPKEYIKSAEMPNSNNRRGSVKYTFNGKSLSISEWAREYGLDEESFRSTMKRNNLDLIKSINLRTHANIR